MIENGTEGVIQGVLSERMLFTGQWERDLEQEMRKHYKKVHFHAGPDLDLISHPNLLNKWIEACDDDNGFALGTEIYFCPKRPLAAEMRSDGSPEGILADYNLSVSHEAAHLASLKAKAQDDCITNSFPTVYTEKTLKSLIAETKADYKADWSSAYQILHGYTYGMSDIEYIKAVNQPFCGKNGSTHPSALRRITAFMRVMRMIPAMRERLHCSALASNEPICTTFGRFPDAEATY